MKSSLRLVPFLVGILLITIAANPLQAGDNPNPPDEIVKLIFIHHSTGENWLKDDYGNLGRTLDQNNYFVSDTNYGWGPDAIGDRTDIPNWTEWFATENTPRYMDALFKENEQHASYTRTLSDPGGENAIIMFKSCFPNSALEGNPNDPPDPEGELTVGHAKYAYNEILKYFAAHPNNLFVVITAPPLIDGTYGANARAFNQWLVKDWLRENQYTLSNVAVFDFYNILTGPDAHHRYKDGQIEHILGGQNTSYYPSEDDHPSAAGSQKATEEFVPLLNVFYHRWKAGAPQQIPQATQAPVQVSPEPVTAAPISGSNPIADFDQVTPYLNAYWDDSSSTRITCGTSNDFAHSGSASLKIDFDVTSGAWATCVIAFDVVQNWSNAQGLSFAIHAQRADIPYDVNIYTGSQDNHETYLDSAGTPADSVNSWAIIDIPWNEFHRAAWEDAAEPAFDKPDQINEIAIGFNGLDTANNTGVIWIDDIHLLQPETSPAAVQTAPANAQPTQVNASQPERKPALPCAGALILPLLLLGLVQRRGKKQ